MLISHNTARSHITTQFILFLNNLDAILNLIKLSIGPIATILMYSNLKPLDYNNEFTTFI